MRSVDRNVVMRRIPVNVYNIPNVSQNLYECKNIGYVLKIFES